MLSVDRSHLSEHGQSGEAKNTRVCDDASTARFRAQISECDAKKGSYKSPSLQIEAYCSGTSIRAAQANSDSKRSVPKEAYLASRLLISTN